ncbi:MAG: hypothetical protein A2Y10_06190 [Planctomycetes bacterium GWF2_41_51]|nr:MAG: hypothetical protein A2Y10_06190 [Planctomycetes bacterium GWF2_41_51]
MMKLILVFLIPICLFGGVFATAQSSMIAYWTMDNLSSPGSQISGAPATSILGNPIIIDGIIGSAMYFDGQSALYVEDSGDYFDDMYKSCTVSCWIKTTDSGSWRGYVNKYSGSGAGGWALRMNSNSQKPSFTTVGTGGVENGSQGDVNIADNRWHHVVGTFNGYEKKIYVDGQLRATDVVENNLITPASHRLSIGIGRLNSDGTVSNGLVGAIDEVRLYTSTLSAVEIGQLYAAGNESICLDEYPVGDLNKDCEVNFKDIALMADNWLHDYMLTGTSSVTPGEGSMIAYWAMDSLSSPGSEVIGTPSTSILGNPIVVQGITGSAVHFDGQSAFYVSQSGNYFNDMYSGCSVSCWVRTTAGGSWLGYINKYGGSTGWVLRMNSSSKTPCFTTRGTGIDNENGSQGVVNVADGQWHHIVGTFDGNEKKIYVDGFFRATDVLENNLIAPTSSPLSIGAARLVFSNGSYTVSNGFIGAIDEVRLYNYALSPLEVGQLFATTANENICIVYPEGDLNKDCKVDFEDFAKVSQNINKSNLIYPTVPDVPTIIDVMNFNIRYGTADDGENSWEYRKDLVIHVIEAANPDIIGLQEALRFQIDYIRSNLPGYNEIGEGRSGGTNGEYNSILYRSDKFSVDIMNSGTFWLSDTPEVPGSKSWGNIQPRICTWGKFIERNTNVIFYFYNTHLDQNSDYARRRSVKLIAERIAAHVNNDSFFVTGDFNPLEDDPLSENDFIIQFMRGEVLYDGYTNPHPVVDTFRVLYPDEINVACYHNFTGRIYGNKGDFIFVPAWLSEEVLEAEINRYSYQGRYPSDHYPSTAKVRISANTQ